VNGLMRRGITGGTNGTNGTNGIARMKFFAELRSNAGFQWADDGKTCRRVIIASHPPHKMRFAVEPHTFAGGHYVGS
jgi:hypothetical protein